MLKETPSPLAIVAIAEGAIAHGAVAYHEEHGIVALARRPWCGPCHKGFVDTVGCVVHHVVYVFKRFGCLGKGHHRHCH